MIQISDHSAITYTETDTNLHGLCDFLSCDGGLNPAGSGVHPGGHPQVVEGLVLLSDGVLRVYPGDLQVQLRGQTASNQDYPGYLMVSLLDGFLQLQLLCLFLFVAFLAASLQLLGGELQVEQMLLHAGHRHRGKDN